MSYESIKMRGIGVFRGEVSVDFTELPGKIVAVTGENGSGKTTLLEALHALAHRETPTRGSLIDLATGRDSMIEGRVVNGSSYTIRHYVDAVSKKSEALVLDADGAPVLSDTKVTSFDAWAEKHFPSREVELVSMFAAQEEERFIDLKPGPRKERLCRILGIEDLEWQAKAARDRAEAIRGTLAGLDAKLQVIPEANVDAEEMGLTSARRTLVEFEATLTQGRKDHESSMAYRAKAAQRAAAQTELADVETRVANNRQVLADGGTIRSAAAELAELRERRAAEDTAVALAEQEASTARRRAQELREADAQAQRDATAAFERVTKLQKVLEIGPDLKDAERMVPEARALLEQAAADLDAKRRELASSITSAETASADRIHGLRDALHDIAADEFHAADRAQAALNSDDDRVKESRSLPEKRSAIESDIAAIERFRSETERTLRGLETRAARRGEYDRASADLEVAERDYAAAKARYEAAHAAAEAPAEDLSARVSAAKAARDATVARMLDVEPVARKAVHLDAAETKLSEYEPRAADLRARIAALQAELDALVEPLDVPIADLEANARRAATDVAVREERVIKARENAARRDEIQAEIDRLHPELSDWALLGEDLGRSGLQALLIDAAGPELTALVNDLLSSCYGTRFSVSIDTTRAVDNGKREKETCDINVIDTKNGRESRIETYSGGEKCLLGECISLALAMLVIRRTGTKAPTLVRDETAAALDEEKAAAYISILRRAAEIVGASRVFFVSHQPGTAALADARLEIADGKVSVS